MPFYEFYCPDCHRLFNFYARRINTTARPACPRCERPEMERQVSLFAISKGRGDSDEDDDALAGMDEAKLERALGSMAGELEHLDENDPKAAAKAMRKLFKEGGLKMGDSMEEAIARMEGGEDPDQIEAELGDTLESDEPFTLKGGKIGLNETMRRRLPPAIDEGIYEL